MTIGRILSFIVKGIHRTSNSSITTAAISTTSTMPSSSTTSFKLAIAQLNVCTDISMNISNAVEYIHKAKQQGADMVCLPECFNCPYGTQFFEEYAQSVPNGETCRSLSDAAKDAGVWLIGGSIPERAEDGRLYNTATVWNNVGELVATHRKVHLFDIDVPGRMTFKESETLSPGDAITVVDTPWCRIGVAICYDIRFPELSMIARTKGAELLLFPGAFNLVTGPAHWELLLRARANDNQLYSAGIAPARDTSAGYQSWGHSMVVGPWADVLVSAKEKQELLFADIDLAKVKEVRRNIPISLQKRYDLYEVVDKQKS